MLPLRHTTYLLACAALGAQAQVHVQVLDAATSDPLQNAHVIYASPDGTIGSAEVTDGHGMVTIPGHANFMASGVVVRISHVGFRPFLDTLPSMGDHVLLLERSTQSLPEVVITGQYAPTSPDKAVHKVRILDQAYFERIAANNLAEGLRNELNIRLRQDNILGTSMSMQGMGGENVKILIDGVPLIGRVNGSIDLSQLDITGIERAEIIEGPLSVSYGTNALAGTINLITKKRDRAPASLKATAYAEHIGRLNTTLTGTRAWAGNDLLLSFGRNYFGGWSPDVPMSIGPAPADTSRFQQWKPREQYFGRFAYRRVLGAWEIGYKGELMSDRILNRGRPRAPYLETAFDEEYLTRRVDNALFAEKPFQQGSRLNALIAHNHYTRTRNTWFRDLTTLSEQLADIEGMQDTALFTLTNARAVYSSSKVEAAIHYELGMDLNLETGSGERIGDGTQKIGDHAVFGSMEVRASDRITLRPGVRYAYNTRYNAPLIPSLNMRWQLNDRYTMRASYARGFRAPSLKELHFLFVDVNHDIVGNEDLEAERSHHFSAGITGQQDLGECVLRSEFSAFYNDVVDLITLAQVQGTRYTYVNIGGLRTMGGTLGVSWSVERWSFSLGGSITARYDEIIPGLQEDVFWTPEISSAITSNWGRNWTLSVNGKYQGQQVNYFQSTGPDVERAYISDMILADLSVARSVWQRRARFTLGCKDLFNVRNVNASVPNAVHGSGGSSVPMTTGRTVFLRLDLSLNKKEG